MNMFQKQLVLGNKLLVELQRETPEKERIIDFEGRRIRIMDEELPPTEIKVSVEEFEKIIKGEIWEINHRKQII